MTTSGDPFNDEATAKLAFEILKADEGEPASVRKLRQGRRLRLLQEALRESELLIQVAKDRGNELIHAYRVFPRDEQGESEPINTQQIFERFEEVGWTEGMSRTTVHTRVHEILDHAELEVERRENGLQLFLEHHNFSLPPDYRFEELVWGFIEKSGLETVVSDSGSLAARISAVVRHIIDEALNPVLRDAGHTDSPTDPLSIAYFTRYLRGDPFLDEGESGESPVRGELRVRPFELFLYAHQQGILEGKLTKRRSKLSPDFIPESVYSSSLSIMVAYAGADTVLKKWSRDDDVRRRQKSGLRSRTEKGVPGRDGAKVKESAKKATRRATKKSAKKKARGAAEKKKSGKRPAKRSPAKQKKARR